MARRLTADDVATAAEMKGVPPELALAIWQQESSLGKNSKTSPKGAVGDFQVMPATFKRYMPNGDIRDPVDNMMAGLSVLADGLRKSGGDTEGAAHFYYHGKVLPAGVEGPDSGPGTPTTRGYGKQIAAKAEQIRLARGGTPTQVASAEPNMYGASEQDAAPDVNNNEDIAGLTRPLDLSTSQQGMGGMGDLEMGMLGSQNYELDRYVRKIVDQEFKSNA